jgi:hypothetical protein
MPGLFNEAFSEADMRTAAKETYHLVMEKSKLSPPSLLQDSVISIPGYGMVADTIWHGSDPSFEDKVQADAPKLWRLAERKTRRYKPHQLRQGD